MLRCIENVLDATQVAEARALIEDQEFEDGCKTAGYRARRVKHNLQLAATGTVKPAFDEVVQNALYDHEELCQMVFPRHIRPVLVSKYLLGMSYGAHVDDALMGGRDKYRSDVAMTLFLSDPAEYVGGELFIEQGFGAIAVKLPAGAVVIYPANTIHRVAEVTEGQRLAAVTWIESHVRCPNRREMLADLARIKRRLHALEPDGEETSLAFKSYSNLLRTWAET
jgi:PKHD-type hydroxylase